MRFGRLACHAVDDPACFFELAGDSGDATGGGESGRLPKALGEGDGEPEGKSGFGSKILRPPPRFEPKPLGDLQQESDDSATPGEGVSAACVSLAEIEKDASASW